MLTPSIKAGRMLIAMTFALACIPATASARPVDTGPIQDLRSPDARDAANAAAARIEARQDLRSPDTRDIAAGRKFPPAPTVVTLREVRDPEVASSGFDWIAAAAGACLAFGLIVLATAGVLLVRRRTHHEQPVAVS